MMALYMAGIIHSQESDVPVQTEMQDLEHFWLQTLSVKRHILGSGQLTMNFKVLPK
jgi:hypothetical protein